MGHVHDEIKILKQALSFIWSRELKFIFPDRNLLKKIVVIIFGDTQLWILTTKQFRDYQATTIQKLDNQYTLYTLSHKISLIEKDFGGWYSGTKKELLLYLPKILKTTSQLEYPRISGPVASKFLAYHKLIKKVSWPLDPYTTKESFMATILHEFGHAYFDCKHPSWHGSKKDNLKLLKSALLLFSGQNIKIDFPIQHLQPMLNSEIFAFCCEYFASILFWPKHKQAIDKEVANALMSLIEKERKINLNHQASIFDSPTTMHYAASTLGRIIIAKYNQSWPKFFK